MDNTIIETYQCKKDINPTTLNDILKTHEKEKREMKRSEDLKMMWVILKAVIGVLILYISIIIFTNMFVK